MSQAYRPLIDAHGRTFRYLRLSVTDACNFRCEYCLPNGFEAKEKEPELTLNEIKNLVSAFAARGFEKVRITGGEPTVRRDLVEIVRMVALTPGVRKVALSTNGTRLKELARPLREAGVSAINISVDSLNPETFRSVTGHDRLNEILSGIDAALSEGIASVKLNAVLLAGRNDKDLPRFLDFVKTTPVTVRFIELMETSGREKFFGEKHVSAGAMKLELLSRGWTVRERARDAGPAMEFTHPDYAGSIGLIAPYSKDFCTNCNRLRVTSRGALKLCLFGDKDLSLRKFLTTPDQSEALMNFVYQALETKEPSHKLLDRDTGSNSTFSAMGG